MRYRLRENNRESNSSNEEFDSFILNFLLRRVTIVEKELTSFLDNKKEIKRLKSEIEKLEKESEKNKSKIEELKKELKLLLPLKVIEYTFEGFPGYGFNSYQAKAYWTKQILELLEEAEIIPKNWHGDPRVKNSERQKIIRTVREFIKIILTK